MTYARFYAFFSILLSLTVIVAPALVLFCQAPAELFREILMTAFPIWLVVSLVSIPIFRKLRQPVLAPASFVAFVCVIFGLAVLVGESNQNSIRLVRDFLVPAFMWLFMFYYGTVSWLTFALGKKDSSR